ncbi:hypothetical protein EME01_00010 [Sinorhizobium meliloti]|nr:hypothetical protein EME01_00010 [Sinorhizobium meliloti]
MIKGSWAAIGAVPGRRLLIASGDSDLDFRLEREDLVSDLVLPKTQCGKLLGELPAFAFPVADCSGPMYPVEFTRAAVDIAGACRQRKRDYFAAPDHGSFTKLNCHRITLRSSPATSIG